MLQVRKIRLKYQFKLHDGFTREPIRRSQILESIVFILLCYHYFPFMRIMRSNVNVFSKQLVAPSPYVTFCHTYAE